MNDMMGYLGLVSKWYGGESVIYMEQCIHNC